MPIVHQVITGIVYMLVVGSTATIVTAGETVPQLHRRTHQRRSIMNVDGISSRSLSVTMVTRPAMLKREARCQKKSG